MANDWTSKEASPLNEANLYAAEEITMEAKF
jgi:hypothetical protein